MCGLYVNMCEVYENICKLYVIVYIIECALKNIIYVYDMYVYNRMMHAHIRHRALGHEVECLREFVLRATVILTPGACGREVPSGSPWTGSAGSAGSAGSPGSADGIIFSRFRHKNNENETPISKL